MALSPMAHVKYLRCNILTHEFTHQVHSLLPQDLKDEILGLYLEAKKNRRTLDWYADSNEREYLEPCRPFQGHAEFPFERHSHPPNQPVAE